MKPVNNLLNRQFGRLTVISRTPNPGARKNDTAAYWNCLCICGNTIIIRSYSLTSGKTQSCGCLKKESPHLAKYQLTKYSAEIVAAKNVWRRDRYSQLPFDIFYNLTQQNCHYCHAPPSIIVYGAQKNNQIPFVYNTLDQVNPSLGHTIDNIVPCCLICNRAKLTRSVEEFQAYLINLKNNTKLSPQQYREMSSFIDLQPLYDPQQYARTTSAKGTHYSYKDGNISMEQFYQLSQMNCYYCGFPPTNHRNLCGKNASKYAKETGTFIYNGLDRIDNNLPHDYDNVIPCCKYCNSAKNTLTLPQFYEWISKF